MPYEPDHPVFDAPADLDAKIWRYMNFTKFVAFLHARSLYFARADRLGDPFEGSFSKANLIPKSQIKDLSEETIEQLPYINRGFVRHTYVNCWHMSEYESAAMWSLYAQRGEGIAVQTTFRRLTESFRVGKKTSIFVGTVKYLDYETDRLPLGNAMSAFMHKRKSFEHEREIRALIQRLPTTDGVADFSGPSPEGREIKVHVKTLVENVYVAPYAEPRALVCGSRGRRVPPIPG
jgi:hypothetical protein